MLPFWTPSAIFRISPPPSSRPSPLATWYGISVTTMPSLPRIGSMCARPRITTRPRPVL